MITVQEGQSMSDIVLQGFGTLDYLVEVSKDNNISISDKLEVKQQLTINNSGLGNQKIKDYYALNSIKPNNDFVNTQKIVNFVFDDEGNNAIYDDEGNNIIYD